MGAATVTETVISGVITGGATAVTTIWGFFKNTKERIEKLESSVGKTEPKSGLLLAMQLLQEALGRMKEQVDKFEAKLQRFEEWGPVGSTRTPMAFDPHAAGMEAGRYMETLRRCNEIGEDLGAMKRKMNNWSEELDAADVVRARELAKIREEIAAISGMVRGLMSVLDNKG